MKKLWEVDGEGMQVFQRKKAVAIIGLLSLLVLLLPTGFRATLVASNAVGGQNGSAIVPAFPGAEGFGWGSVGGRGGKVMVVTTLADSGAGSLRECIEEEGPRICTFAIGGTIELEESLVIENAYITIAGQTAPGGGITLKNSPRSARTPLKIESHDVVVRYIRSRPGSNPDDSGTLDAMTIRRKSGDEVYNVVVDHCSFSWATDEVTNIYSDAHDILVQWSIIAEGLEWATHKEDGELQPHSMGMLLGAEGSKDYALHHNLFAHNRHRNPKVKTSGTVDLVNNVMYNTGAGEGWRAPTYVLQRESGITTPANYVGNYFKPGPDTGSVDYFIETKESVAVYLEGNRVPEGVAIINPESADVVASSRFDGPPITNHAADEAYERVLAEVGASHRLTCDGMFVPRRDAADTRLMEEVRTGTGEIIDDPSEVGGWPVLAAGTPCADTDGDGMPDGWEELHGFDKNDASDNAADADGDVYTNIEEYLNGTDPRTAGTNPLPVATASEPVDPQATATATSNPSATAAPSQTPSQIPTQTPSQTSTQTPVPTADGSIGTVAVPPTPEPNATPGEQPSRPPESNPGEPDAQPITPPDQSLDGEALYLPLIVR